MKDTLFRRSILKKEIGCIIREALVTDGAHHKQWYLELLAEKLGVSLVGIDYEEGIAP